MKLNRELPVKKRLTTRLAAAIGFCGGVLCCGAVWFAVEHARPGRVAVAGGPKAIGLSFPVGHNTVAEQFTEAGMPENGLKK